MKKILLAVGVVLLLLVGGFVAALYIYPKPQIAAATQQAAPDFTLQDGSGATFHLAAQRGHKVVLYFYRGYW
ncbi:MAG: redoxin domain-containing protein [Acidobacteria bacterium]|nr:redoxin domain-containing protein [Acidobacteriota bacterium]MBV9145837.1 redoxin domain-containing protein [Acidobacteriota bacterium]MBV9435230.1 redoxin domain-containing protein [Acidobacteriota bacterium]